LDESQDGEVRAALQQRFEAADGGHKIVADLLGSSPLGSEQDTVSYRTASDQGAGKHTPSQPFGHEYLDYMRWKFGEGVEEAFVEWDVEAVKKRQREDCPGFKEETDKLTLVKREVLPVTCLKGGFPRCPSLAVTSEAGIGYLVGGIHSLMKNNEAALGSGLGLGVSQPQRTCDITREKLMSIPLEWLAKARIGSVESVLPSGIQVCSLLGASTLNACVFRWLLLAGGKRIPTRWPEVAERFCRDWKDLLQRGVCRTQWDTG